MLPFSYNIYLIFQIARVRRKQQRKKDMYLRNITAYSVETHVTTDNVQPIYTHVIIKIKKTPALLKK
jgi:hypothetical protein